MVGPYRPWDDISFQGDTFGGKCYCTVPYGRFMPDKGVMDFHWKVAAVKMRYENLMSI